MNKRKHMPECLAQYGDTMQAILDKLKSILGAPTDEELATRLYVHKLTLLSWKYGLSYPSKVSQQKICQILIQQNWGDPQCQRDAFIAYNTISFDSVRKVYDKIAEIGDPIALSCAVHSILVKIACLIENYNAACIVSETKGMPIQKMHSVYGVPDYGEIMNCKYLQYDGRYSPYKSDIFVKVAIINGKACFVYQLENILNNSVQYKTSGVISDIAIDKIANKIIKHLTKYINK